MVENGKDIAQSDKLKNARRHPFYHLHRHISWHLTRALLRASVSANSATGLMVFVWILGVTLLVTPLGIFTPFLLYLSFLLDKCDGEISRVMQTESKLGAYVDEIFHLFSVPTLLVAIFFSQDSRGSFALPALAIFFYCGLKYERKVHHKYSNSQFSIGSTLPEWFAQDDVLILTLLLCLMFEAPKIFLFYCVFFFALALLFRIGWSLGKFLWKRGG